jgi:hypothetical protein
LGLARGFLAVQRIFPSSKNFSQGREFLVPLGIFGGMGFLSGFKEFFPPLANLVCMAEIEHSTKKVGNDIL